MMPTMGSCLAESLTYVEVRTAVKQDARQQEVDDGPFSIGDPIVGADGRQGA